MKKRKDSLKISVTTEDKNFIKEKSKKLGFGSASAFLVETSKTYFRLNVDMSVYRKLIKEINFIGKNINSLVRRVNTEKIYTDADVELLERRLEEIYDLINEEYTRLMKLAFDFTSDNVTHDQTMRLIKSFEKNSMLVPKYLLLEEVYEKIHDSMVLISEMIHHSKYQEENVEEYLWDYLYGKTLSGLSENDLIQFSSEIYQYYEQMRIKSINLEYHFTDNDWIDLLDILDEYEIE